MPDVIVTVEVERRYRDGEQSHQAASTGNGEVNATALTFQFPDEIVKCVKSSIGVGIINDVVDWLPVQLENVRVEMNNSPGLLVKIANKFRAETGERLL